MTASPSLPDESTAPADGVRHALGVGTVVHHVVAPPGSGPSGVRAANVGTGPANGHSALARDVGTIRSRVRRRTGLMDGMAGAATGGVRRAHDLLAAAIAPRDGALAELPGAADPDPDPDVVRKLLLASVGGRTPGTPPEPDAAVPSEPGR